jgi:tRNA(fMet)-specific endonuclease VapC
MLEYMLDTNICIYVLKNRPPERHEKFDRMAELLRISSITLCELYYGAETSTRRLTNLETSTEFIARLEVLDFSATAAAHHGQLRADLERQGQPARPYDMLIGAPARSESLIVATNNRREFARMPGGRAENWV